MNNKGANVFDGTIPELKSKYDQIRELHFETNIENVKDILTYNERFSFFDDDFSIEENRKKIRVRFN